MINTIYSYACETSLPLVLQSSFTSLSKSLTKRKRADTEYFFREIEGDIRGFPKTSFMASLCYSTVIPTHSDSRASCLAFQTSGQSWVLPKRSLQKRRHFGIRAEVDYVDADEAKKLVAADGYAIVDVRDKYQFERAHIKSCYHVPLFIENKDNDPGTVIKRTLHNNFSGLFYGLPFTKPNPEFVESVKSKFSPDSKLLLVCQEGLRATAAAKKLEESGFRNVVCITSGLQSVKPGTFDSVGSTELQDAGKAGLVTIQGKISAVLGTILVCAFLFITFFPDQAEQLMQMVPAS
ncbi:Rhodanese-like domain-containing protein 9 chloroplastic [Bienertia sinuspersici]